MSTSCFTVIKKKLNFGGRGSFQVQGKKQYSGYSVKRQRNDNVILKHYKMRDAAVSSTLYSHIYRQTDKLMQAGCITRVCILKSA